MNGKFLSGALLFVLGFTCLCAEATKRLGSGKSVGQRSNNVSQTQGASKTTQNATPARPPPAFALQKCPWGALLGGLAAGLGLAWLASSIGLGEELGQFLMFGLIALGVMIGVRNFIRRRASASKTDTNSSPLAFQGAGVTPPKQPQDTQFIANPEDQSSSSASNGSMIVSAFSGFQPNWLIPTGVDADGFVTKAKENFVARQDVWDRSDTKSLRNLMTNNMLKEITAQIAERDATASVGHTIRTEVIRLEAKLLGIEESLEGQLASVEISGAIREEADAQPDVFKEVWNMSLNKSSHCGQLIAGINAS